MQLKNPHKFEDKTAQRFSDLWQKQAYELSSQQKHNIGLAYLEHIIGPDKKTAIAFAEHDGNAYHEIGMKQGNASPKKNDCKAFWEEIAKIIPDTYAPQDLQWLIEKAGGEGASHMLWQMEDVPRLLKKRTQGFVGIKAGELIFDQEDKEETPQTSELLFRISVNAHAYK